MSKIEWTNETWNPIIGCEKISEGCSRCYAEIMANRLAHIPATMSFYSSVIDNGKWNGNVSFVHNALEKPFKWKKPRMIFVCSMGDLFHESVSFEWVDKVIDVIRWNKQHTFQILTKRPEKMRSYFTEHVTAKYLVGENPEDKYLPNLWLGASAENQEQLDKRIPILLSIPAAKHFLSGEPLLENLSISDYVINSQGKWLNSVECGINYLNWVIVGGESGHKARPMHPNWVRSIRDQCKKAKVPFFFKQWGEWTMTGEELNFINFPKELVPPDTIRDHTHSKSKIEKTGYIGIMKYPKGIWFEKVGKKEAGSLLDGQEHKQFPKVK